MALEAASRKRVRSSRKLVDLEYFDSTDFILTQQKKVSEQLSENGELFL